MPTGYDGWARRLIGPEWAMAGTACSPTYVISMSTFASAPPCQIISRTNGLFPQQVSCLTVASTPSWSRRRTPTPRPPTAVPRIHQCSDWPTWGSVLWSKGRSLPQCKPRPRKSARRGSHPSWILPQTRWWNAALPAGNVSGRHSSPA